MTYDKNHYLLKYTSIIDHTLTNTYTVSCDTTIMKDRIGVYDIWSSEAEDRTNKKLHPSQKRKEKNELPHPGQSYNPNPKDHRKLLRKLMKDEIKFINKAKKLDKETRQLKKQTKNHDEIDHRDEIDDESTDDEAFEDYNENDFKQIAKDRKVREKRKTPQQRKRELKDKLQKKAAKVKKAKNLKSEKFNGVKKLVKQLDAKDKEHKEKLKKRQKRRTEKFCQQLELSDPIYCMKSALPSNLRQVACPMRKVVREQFETFQKRLIVEPCQYQTSFRRYNKRRYERRTGDDKY